MDLDRELQWKLDRLAKKDGRYKWDAYAFVQEAVQLASRRKEASQHICAGEILENICLLAVASFGPLAASVLADWKLKSALDVGNVVFALIEGEILYADEQDNLEEYQFDFDFNEKLNGICEKANSHEVKVPIIE